MILSNLSIVLYSLFLCLNTSGCTSPEKNKEKSKEDHVMDNKIISDSTIVDSLISIDKNSFIGKPVDSFLMNEIASKYKESVFVDAKPGMLTCLSLKYSDSVFVEIEVVEYKYMNPFDVNRKWSLDLFKREKISQIKILYDNKYIGTEK